MRAAYALVALALILAIAPDVSAQEQIVLRSELGYTQVGGGV